MNSEKKRTTLMMIERANSGESLDQMLKAIKQSRKLSQILLPKMGTMSNEVLADLAGCSRAYVYGIMGGTKHPEKDMLLRIAFVLGMSVDETQEMLQTAHRAVLSSKDKRDICVIFGLVNGLDLETMDEVLMEQDQKPLSPFEKDEGKLRDLIVFHLEKKRDERGNAGEKRPVRRENLPGDHAGGAVRSPGSAAAGGAGAGHGAARNPGHAENRKKARPLR